MLKNSSKVLALAIVAVAFVFAAGAQANTILFNDTFNGATAGTDYGLNDNLGSPLPARLTGTLATNMITAGKAWGRDATSATNGQVKVNNTSYPDVMMCQRNGSTASYGTAIIQNNFNTSDIATAGGFDLIFSVLPQASNATNGAVIALGINSANASEWGATTSALFPASIDLDLYIRSNGKLGIRHGGADIGNNAGYLAGYAGTDWNTFKLHVATTSFAAGTGTATATLFYSAGKNTSNFNQIAFSDAAGAGLSADFKSFTWTWDDGNNYIGLSQYVGSNGVTQYDDVQVSANIVPEPSTLALLAGGLMGLLAYAWRKRK